MNNNDRPDWLNEDGTINEDAARRALDAASERANANAVAEASKHAAFHGRTVIRRGRVEARRGYLGRNVCLDCYYGKEYRG